GKAVPHDAGGFDDTNEDTHDDFRAHHGRDRHLLMRRVLSLLCVVGLVFFGTGCGSDSKGGSGAKTLEFTITDEGCNPAQTSTTPGSTNFHVKNTGANNITEFEVLDTTGHIV